MKRTESNYLILLLAIIGLTSFKSADIKLKGVWLVETVIYENDTLYVCDKYHITTKFYNSRINGWEKTEIDKDYIQRCLKSTFLTFKNTRLTFDRETYSQTDIKPCWEHIDINGVNKGNFTLKNESIGLFNSKKELNMLLFYNPNTEMLTYLNAEFDFKIIFKKGNRK